MLGSKPGPLQLRVYWQSDALTTKLDLIQTKLDLIQTKLDLILTKLDLIHSLKDYLSVISHKQMLFVKTY